MPPKKKKKTIKNEDSYNTEKLAKLGIYEDDEPLEEDERGSWRSIG